jgi:hypothetical protein
MYKGNTIFRDEKISEIQCIPMHFNVRWALASSMPEIGLSE